MDRLLAGLDEDQRAAVVDPHRPLAILAPAGSGKTRVLTRRVAYLAATGALDSAHSLCVAFTRDAAGELRTRLARLGLRDLPAAGTFHAIALALLRAHWADQGRRAPELVDDRAGYLRRLFPDLSPAQAGQVETEIGWAKARAVAPAGYPAAARQAGRRPAAGTATVVERWRRYEEATANARLVDFDDLLARCAAAFEEDPDYAAAQRWRFRHLFVDEYQDVNPLQFRLLRAWLGEGPADLTVVGDPGQAIYGWNGADAGYLEHVAEHFPGTVIHELRRNHRSSPQVVAVAGAVRGGAPVLATRPEGEAPVVVAYPDEAAEAAGVVQWVRDLGARGVPLRQQAVLVRTNALARHLGGVLEAAGIPQRVVLPRGTRTRLSDLLPAGVGRNEPLGAVVADLVAAAAPPVDDGGGDDDDLPVAGAAGGGGAGHLELLLRLSADYLALDPAATVGRFSAWLAASPGALQVGRDGVTVATFHAAKGLEWRCVHVAALEDGYVPVAGADTRAARAEEQRLLYVAVTRATESLTCSWTQARTFRDRPETRRRSPLLEPVVRACADVAADLAPAPPPDALHGRFAAGPGNGVGDAAGGGAADLLIRLRRWRDRQARASRVLPDAVLPDDVLAAVAEAAPDSLDRLASVPGVGPVRARLLGPGLLAALGET